MWKIILKRNLIVKKYFLCFAGFFIASFMFAENGKFSANDLLLKLLKNFLKLVMDLEIV